MFVFVQDAAEPVVSSYVESNDLVGVRDWRGQRAERAGVGDALVGPMFLVELLEFP